METKFTKGEWKVERFVNNKGFEISFNDDGEVVADYIYEEADAHLIAAAPSMYAMLEEVAKELYNLIDEVNDQRLSHVNASSLTQPELCDGETIHNIQLLLAKARGE